MNRSFPTVQNCYAWRVYLSTLRGAVWAMFLAVIWGMAVPLAIASDVDEKRPKQTLAIGLDVQTGIGQPDDYEQQREPVAFGGHLRLQRGRFAYEPSFNTNIYSASMELGVRLRFGVTGIQRTMLEVIVDPRVETRSWIVPLSLKVDWGLAVTHRVNELLVVSLQLTNNLLGQSFGPLKPPELNLSFVPAPSVSLTFVIPPSEFSKPKRKRSKRSAVE